MWKSPSHVRLLDLGGVDLVEPVDLAHLRGDVVVEPLERVVHVAVFVDLPVRLGKVLVHQVDLHLVDDFPQPGVLVAVDDVGLGGFAVWRLKQGLLDDVLDFFDAWNPVAQELLGQREHLDRQAPRGSRVVFLRCCAGFGDGVGDLVRVKFDNTTIPLPNLTEHSVPPLLRFYRTRA